MSGLPMDTGQTQHAIDLLRMLDARLLYGAVCHLLTTLMTDSHFNPEDFMEELHKDVLDAVLAARRSAWAEDDAEEGQPGWVTTNKGGKP